MGFLEVSNKPAAGTKPANNTRPNQAEATALPGQTSDYYCPDQVTISDAAREPAERLESSGQCQATAALQTPDAYQAIKERVGDAYRLLQQTVVGKFKVSLSHGCVHIPQMVLPALLSYGFGKGSTVTVHPYKETFKGALPEPLMPTGGGKFKPKELSLEVYPGSGPGGEVAILYHKGKAVGYFQVAGGPEEARMASNNKEATPTPIVTKQTVANISPYDRNRDYTNANLVGGARIKIDGHEGTVTYSTDGGKSWQKLTHPPLVATLLDPKARRQITKSTEQANQFIYTGNDFGNGYFDPQTRTQKPGQIIRVNGMGGSYFHSCATTEADQSFAQVVLNAFFILPDATPDSLFTERKQPYFQAYLEVAQGKRPLDQQTIELLQTLDPELVGMEGVELEEAVDLRARSVYNVELMHGLLERLVPVKQEILTLAAQAGIDVTELGFGIFVEQVLKGVDHKIAMAEFLRGKDGMVITDESGGEYDEIPLTMADGSTSAVEVFKEGGQVTIVSVTIPRLPNDTPETFLARAEKARDMAQEKLPGLKLRRIAPQELGRFNDLKANEKMSIDVYDS